MPWNGKERRNNKVVLENLRKLTYSLPSFPDTTYSCNKYKEYKMTKGHSHAWHLWEEPNVSVAKWFNSIGSKFPKHAHKEREWLIVFYGLMKITFYYDDKVEDKIVKSGDYCKIEPGTVHSAEFPEDTHYLAITIPSTKDWPKWKNS